VGGGVIMSLKLVWKVGSVPTGRYRSFEKRSWPNAYFSGADNAGAAASIDADESYEPRHRKMNDVGFDLTVRITIVTDQGWEWRTLKKKARSINEAKELALNFYKQNQQYVR